MASKMSKFAASNPQGICTLLVSIFFLLTRLSDSPRTMQCGTRSELERNDTDEEDSAIEILASTLAGTSITL